MSEGRDLQPDAQDLTEKAVTVTERIRRSGGQTKRYDQYI
jgi:hypothetical protein